ncbi:hypothetical protein HJC23_006261 [Cyclotella cryptica]|uniref:Peptidase M12B domain-containing protein n=1 Tax=Cyclotella cryptica TaxID=29204 RepID=A0ABD3PM16_9STRA
MDPFVKAPQALIMDQIRKIHVPHFSELGDRIKIPLDTRLLDALRDYESASQWNRHIFEKKIRRFEIETHDETTNSVATVQVQEVKNMGITSKTTYNFNSRQFDSGKIDISILASYDSKEQDMTILSVNKSTGRVRGLHREASSGKARNVGNDDDGRLRTRLLQEVRDRREWTCGAVGHGHDKGVGVDLRSPLDKNAEFRSAARKKGIQSPMADANLVFEHEVDAHLNVVHIEETDLFDGEMDAKEALKLMRIHYSLESNSTNNKVNSNKFRLRHAVLGRYLGGGIAFIDSVCDKDWGFGVTSDISGTLKTMDENVLFDFFIFIHEVGHSLGSGHTFDAYDPPVDSCGPCSMPGSNSTVDGLPLDNSATIMSYCNFCDGGLSNIALTLGGEWKGLDPRNELTTWENNPAIEGDVSNDPRRVPHLIWETLSSKGDCVAPPLQFNEVQGCNEDSDCDDFNECTTDSCHSNFCTVSDISSNCCGNGVCELGELSDNCTDCGPFHIEPAKYCEECFALDGFMFEVRLSKDSERDVFISSISFMHASLTDADAAVALYATLEGSYLGKESSSGGWEYLSSIDLPSGKSSDFAEIAINPPLTLAVGSKRAFYLFASESIILFGQGVYAIKNSQGVELYSSRAVTGLFGDGIDGFSLSCSITYVLNDVKITGEPTHSTTAHPIGLFPIEGSRQPAKGEKTSGNDSSSSSHSSFAKTEIPQGSEDKPTHVLPGFSNKESPGPINHVSLCVLLLACVFLVNNIIS